jgi:hypothetical protein
VQGKTDLEGVLAAATRALAVLDADAIEGLAEFLEGHSGNLDLPRSAAEWKRLRSRQWIFGHLLEGTGRRLEMLRQVSPAPERLASYGGRSLRLVPPRRAIPLAAPDARSKGESFRSHIAAGEAAN